MNFFGLDISKRRIGIGRGYVFEDKIIVLPWKVIDPKDFSSEISKLKSDYNEIQFIIGLPGKKYENFIRVKHFAHKYRGLLSPFYFQDENYTTMMVSKEENKKSLTDDLAACAILELFFASEVFFQLKKQKETEKE